MKKIASILLLTLLSTGGFAYCRVDVPPGHGTKAYKKVSVGRCRLCYQIVMMGVYLAVVYAPFLLVQKAVSYPQAFLGCPEN